MKKGTKIEWADFTNCFWWGCDKVSEACQFCYAENIAKMWGKRLFGAVPEWGKGKPRQQRLVAARKQLVEWNNKAHRFVECMVCGLREFRTTGESRVGLRCCSTPGCLALPESDTMPVRPRIFINSMSDWLDEEVPIEWFAFLLESLWLCPNLDFLLLTKRPENWPIRIGDILAESGAHDDDDAWPWHQTAVKAEDWLLERAVPPNFWIGTTVENQERADKRIPHLLNIPAKVRFLSCEPLLSAVDLSVSPYPLNIYQEADRVKVYTNDPIPLERPGRGLVVRRNGEPLIHWVIAGGESGGHARPSHPDWFRSLREQCLTAKVPFLFKQWGEYLPAGTHDAHLPKEKNFKCKTVQGSGIPYPGEVTVNGHTLMLRPGKDLAGRLLDGQEWNQFPASPSKPATH